MGWVSDRILYCYKSYRWGRESVSLLPVAQRTMEKMIRHGVIGSTWVAGGEFESHVHHGNTSLFKDEWISLCQEPEKNTSGTPKNWNRVLVARRPVYPISGPFQGGRVLQGLDWVGARLTFYQ